MLEVSRNLDCDRAMGLPVNINVFHRQHAENCLSGEREIA